jgi:serine/threonine protein kinase
MDKLKAKALETNLLNKKINNYTIIRLINNGKSAAVFEGKDDDGNSVAIKIFDNELIERFGQEMQLKRIEQELSLKDHSITGLVKIIDGGSVSIEHQNIYYLVMEFIEGKNLKEFIKTEEYDIDFIHYVVRFLVEISEELLFSKNLAHRDIKPENIIVNAKRQILLMDLGVLKFVGVKSFSDMEEKQFLGTLRYAPPEFLSRQEEDSSNGWRAVNLYQIGAVLYELLEKKEIFESEIPYPNLVLAIKEQNPTIKSKTAPYDTIQLARNLLIKNWRLRLEVNPISDIIAYCGCNIKINTDLDKEIDSIKSFTLDYSTNLDYIFTIRSSFDKRVDRKNMIIKDIVNIINKAIEFLNRKSIFNAWESTRAFLLISDVNNNELEAPKYILYKLKGELYQGFSRPLYLAFEIINDENAFCQLGIVGFILKEDSRVEFNEDGLFLFNLRKEFSEDAQGYDEFSFLNIFKGVIDPSSDDVLNMFTIAIARLIKKSLQINAEEVNRKIETQKFMSEKGVKIVAVPKYKTITYVINNLA